MRITINTIKKVYKAGKMSVETMELKGYILVEELFVDNSGMGAENELALTSRGFEKRLGELLEEHGQLIAKITREGQFQVYLGFFKTGGEKLAKIVDRNTLEINDPEYRAIRLHDTNVLTFTPGQVVLDSGGWETRTTKARMNEHLPSGLSVFQKDFDWFVRDTRGKETITTYKDGMIIKI